MGTWGLLGGLYNKAPIIMNDNNTSFPSSKPLPTFVCKVAPLSVEEKEELKTRIITETSTLSANKE
jgi:hypothetical protein